MKSKFLAPMLACLFLAPGIFGQASAADDASHQSAQLSLGFRSTDTRDQPARAAEYVRFEDSVVGATKLSDFEGKRHFYLNANYLNDADYSGELHYDQAGLLRFDLFGESLYHNLDHIPYPSPVATVNSPTGGTPLFREDQNPGAVYHYEVHQSSAHVRAKLPSFPAHINLGYWRLDRRGRKQLRYLDESCGGCHQQSRSLDVNRVTEEFTGSVDAHLGPIDLIFEQLVRLFRDKEPLPVDAFEPHNYRTTNTALLVHDENPDSRLITSTVKAHTSLSGGLDGAATVTIGNRTNQSRIDTLGPVEAETDFYKTSGDVTYVPSPEVTFNLRYRLLDLSSENTDVQVLGDILNDPNNPPGSSALASIPVRNSIDQTTAIYAATGTWRPSRSVTFKGDFKRQDISRSNTGNPGDSGVWLLPEKETRNSYRLSAYIHPTSVRSLKVNTWYRYRTSDDPAYALTVAEGHEGFASLTWSPSGSWGLSLNGRVARAENEEHSIFQEADSSGTVFTRYPIHRRSENDNLGAGLWFAIGDRINCSLNYGYIRTRVVQDLVFGTDTVDNLVAPDNGVEYTQHVHSGVFAANLRVLKGLSLRGEGHANWSKARYNPRFDLQMTGFNPSPTTTYTVSSDGLRELSALDTRQLGVMIGLDWEPIRSWTCSARYGYDDYQDHLGNYFDGTAQTVTVSLAKAW